jgi:hypothetical protein
MILNMNAYVERMRKEAVVYYFQVLYQQFPEFIKEDH